MLPRVVITGMGVVSPNGLGKEAFCRAVLAGKSGVKRISRFDSSHLAVHIAGEIPDFDEFAWVEARERKHVSRVVPLCLAATTEALKDSGIDVSGMSIEEKRQIGIILGTGGGAQEFSEHQYRLWHSGKEKQVSLFCIPSGTMGTIPSEISMRFGFRGYSHVVTAGCTSSTDALGYAHQHIQAGVQPMFVAGGVDSPVTEGIVKGYTMIRALTQSWNDSPERASRPFSADRDGFVLAEGSWMFVLEDYDHAKARGARPLRQGAFMSVVDHPAPLATTISSRSSRGYLALSRCGTGQPSMDAIRLAFPPAAVVSMQVTRSVANRAT